MTGLGYVVIVIRCSSLEIAFSFPDLESTEVLLAAGPDYGNPHNWHVHSGMRSRYVAQSPWSPPALEAQNSPWLWYVNLAGVVLSFLFY